ncbi:SRPBCC family protein [Pontiellaceae bacterium B12227]|nr:SRPBCC family protein [Pontiellaceae bacterium B12227]
MYTLHKEIIVDTTLQEAWDFIRNPANLNLITPDDMAFEILTELPEEMTEGMLVEYRVNIPVLGKQPWLSELKHIVPQSSFVDEQKIGPYKLWYHYHGIEACEGGVLFTDHVVYEVPFGFLGKLAHSLFIGKTLERIFSFREKQFAHLLGTGNGLPKSK